MTGIFAYSVAAFFVNFAYRYELPAMSGLVIAMWFAVKRKAPAPVVAEVPAAGLVLVAAGE